MKKINLVVAFMTLATALFAQTEDSKWNVGLHLNSTHYQGDLGTEYVNFSDIDPGLSLSLGYYLSPTFDITVKAGWSYADFMDENGTYGFGNKGYSDKIGYYNKNSKEGWKFYGSFMNASANLKLKLNNGWLLKEEAKVAPFLIGGIGATRINSVSVTNKKSEDTYSKLTLYYGGGLKFHLSERLDMVLEAGIYNPMSDVYDGIDKTTAAGWDGTNHRGKEGHGDVDKRNDRFLQYSIGVTYNLGKKKDSDQDGVADIKDKCPNTPSGVAVDEDGCPIDTDGDGVADYLDKCPKVKGLSKLQGCPDKDDDNDGVLNLADKCPNTPAGVKVDSNGCPFDSDNDGVSNLADKCPNTPAGVKVDSKGCPIDTDGDGVADYLDKCPNEAGAAKTNGCPIQAKLNEFAKQIYFNTNKATLRGESYAILNQIVEILKKYSEQKYNVLINGYTDSVGNNQYNKKLSERRAATVKNYFIQKGISASKLESRGHGEANPIATNKTKEGRAKNRRTEIIVK